MKILLIKKIKNYKKKKKIYKKESILWKYNYIQNNNVKK